MKWKTLCAITFAAGLAVGCGPDTRSHEELYNTGKDRSFLIKTANKELSRANYLRTIEIAKNNNEILERYNRTALQDGTIVDAIVLYNETSKSSLCVESNTKKMLEMHYKLLDIIEEQQKAIMR